MNIIERITELLEQNGYSKNRLAKELGLRPTSISSWVHRNTNPPAEYLPKISEFLGVSIEYLVTGNESSPVSLTSEEKELIDAYRKCDPIIKPKVVKHAKELLEASKQNALRIIR